MRPTSRNPRSRIPQSIRLRLSQRSPSKRHLNLAAERTVHTLAKPRLLFVDDEPSIRTTLTQILQAEGFQVTSCATVPEAIEAINKEKFDVLISDLNVGEPGDGFTVVSAMRRV